ncbi:type I-C CRISPR-associated protein Cas8c/Csd1 [Aedoeadaptatus urinae]|uniref:type I-C CRISPR-associated protein Cas8c/Csd1 n=1 Tax=Aedoeadaptatus urinae TaxID=1871017 RepID=UPI00097D95C2|nr:type I-C CRISPR-associated protein Cas8c/Csd1 [Peptoniphilus urinae]
MSLLTALLDSYDYALEHDMVGKPDHFGHILLPMYYNSMKSNGKNIIELLLSKDSKLLEAHLLPEGETIQFPVTEDSVARSSGVAPHPLVDSASYVIQDEGKRSAAYMEQMENWLTYDDNDFVRIIHDFLIQPGILDAVMQKVKDSEEDEAEKQKKNAVTIDFEKVFFTFSVENYDGLKNISVSENSDLQARYKAYVEHLNANDPSKEKITCNLSGKQDYLCIKHQPLMGTARLVSQITANDENWRGRFTMADQNIKLGMETSQKIHLMAKYLLSGEETRRWLGEQANMVSWFSDDLSNAVAFDPSKSAEMPAGIFEKLLAEQKEKSDAPAISDEMTENIVKSFTNGKRLFSDDATYYIAIFDKISNGRVATKYFRTLSASRLKENLVAWQEKYHWRGYSKENRDKVFTPSPRRLVLAAYGVERDGFLEISKKDFLKNQYQNILTALVEGRNIPENFEKALTMNIRHRQNYDNTWMEVKFCALAVLKDKGGFKDAMLNRENTDRSYLFGRLLALFERMEAGTFGEKEERSTNAEKMWTSYTNHPATMMMRLRNLLKPYERKMATSEQNRGLYFKLSRDISEVTNMLHNNYDMDSAEVNRPLDYGFIFGYEAQMRDIFTKRNKETEEAKEEDHD